jgi:hypothetical protein
MGTEKKRAFFGPSLGEYFWKDEGVKDADTIDEDRNPENWF